MLNEPADNKNNTSAGVESLNSVRFFSHSTRLFSHHIPTEFVLLGFVEFFALMASYYVGVDLRFRENIWDQRFGNFLAHAVLFVFIMQMSLIAFGAYQRQPRAVHYYAGSAHWREHDAGHAYPEPYFLYCTRILSGARRFCAGSAGQFCCCDDDQADFHAYFQCL